MGTAGALPWPWHRGCSPMSWQSCPRGLCLCWPRAALEPPPAPSLLLLPGYSALGKSQGCRRHKPHQDHGTALLPAGIPLPKAPVPSLAGCQCKQNESSHDFGSPPTWKPFWAFPQNRSCLGFHFSHPGEKSKSRKYKALRFIAIFIPVSLPPRLPWGVCHGPVGYFTLCPALADKQQKVNLNTSSQL